MAGLDARELAQRLLSIVVLAKQLQKGSLGIGSDSLTTCVNHMAASLTALYTIRLLDLCPHLKPPSLVVLASYFQVPCNVAVHTFVL